MGIMEVSEFLKSIKVWHRVESNHIRTRKTCIKIPALNCGIAYLAGAITGDGSVSTCKRKKGGSYYAVRLFGRKEKLEHIPKLLSDFFNYKTKIIKDGRTNDCYYINFSAAGIYAYFVLLGLSAGKKRKIVVPQAIADDPSLFKHYMMGLVDTDGHVKGARIHLKQRDEKFLEELAVLLKKHFGIEPNPPKVNYTNGKPYYYIRFPIGTLRENIHYGIKLKTSTT